MKITDEMVMAHATEDAVFAGTEFSALSKADRTRYLERSRRCLTAALAEQTQQGVEAVVPHDPTDAMIDAAMNVNWECDGDERATAINVWHAMYAAALVNVPAVESEPVAWLDDGTCRAGSGHTAHRVVTDEQKRGMLASIAGSFNTPLYAHPPRSLSNEGSEIDADFLARCKEIVEWKKTGKLPGDHLRKLGKAIEERLGGSLFIDAGLTQAELQTTDEALNFIIALSTRKGSATGTSGTLSDGGKNDE